MKGSHHLGLILLLICAIGLTLMIMIPLEIDWFNGIRNPEHGILGAIVLAFLVSVVFIVGILWNYYPPVDLEQYGIDVIEG